MGEWERVVGENVRTLRLARRLTQEALAYEVGLSTRYVGKIERAETSVTVGCLADLAAAFGLEPAELLTQRKPIK